MRIMFPSVRAVMARRILVNFRVQPEALLTRLPRPFRPRRIKGWGLAGICLIRLEQMRPAFLPAALGLSSENAAHRIAVEWTEAGIQHEGVFIPRRDTNSWLNQVAGGRLFPGVHHSATFDTFEADGRFKVELRSRDNETGVRVEAHLTDTWPKGSLFESLDEASEFLRKGGCGWSFAGNNGTLEGVELCTDHWEMHPLAIDRVESSFFADESRFPRGTVEWDSALLMREIPHAWHALEPDALARSSRRAPRHGASALFEMP